MEDGGDDEEDVITGGDCCGCSPSTVDDDDAGELDADIPNTRLWAGPHRLFPPTNVVVHNNITS